MNLHHSALYRRLAFRKHFIKLSKLALNLQSRFILLSHIACSLLNPILQVIQAIPNALGALCLNQAGQVQLSSRPSVIPALFTIFTSQRHLRLLIDKKNAVIIGTAIDELVRHHPLLKAAVFNSLKSTLSAIEEMGRSYQPPDDILSWYQLTPRAGVTGVDADVKMDDEEPLQSESPEADTVGVSVADMLNKLDEASEASHDNIFVSFIDVLCRV